METPDKEFFIGTCQIQLKYLSFLGRDSIDRAVNQLADVLRLSCEPAADRNQIPVVLYPDELEKVLSDSALSLETFVEATTPRLTPSTQLRCVHDRQRHEAALRVEGPNMWWVARLYCIPRGSDPIRLLRSEADEFAFQKPSSDGDIFLKIREYETTNCLYAARDWRNRLSRGKQVSFKAVRNHLQLSEKLDGLRGLPGLWQGLQLGSIARHLASHPHEEMVQYLQHINDIWHKITLEDFEVQQALDAKTVQNLELRVPVCSTDQAVIKEMMESGTLFGSITDPQLRARIHHAILQIEEVITTIECWHEDMRYLSIGVTILKDYIIDESLRNRRCGRPFANSFNYLESTLFLNNILEADGHTSYPSTLFIQRDFIRSILREDGALGADSTEYPIPRCSSSRHI